MVCVALEPVHLDDGLIVLCWVNSDSAGAPDGVPVRVSNPTRVAAVVVAGLAIETAIPPMLGEETSNEQNRSLPAVVVEVT